MRYFFDFRDGESFHKDDIGIDFPDLETVRLEAVRGLVDYAHDVVTSGDRRDLAVEVRTNRGPVLVTKMIFETVLLAG